MTLPEYWLKRPEFDVEPHRDDFEAAFHVAVRAGDGKAPNAPTWAWLSWLCEARGLVAHGTGQGDISVFEPRQSNDTSWFGNRRAVYASSDALWAMFFAIMNRPAVPMRIVNGAVGVRLEGKIEARYFFGVSGPALDQRAFRHGWVYLLPGVGFEREPDETSHGLVLESHHLASLEPVRPVFRVPVGPDDFPFRDRIHAYNSDVLESLVARNPDGFPWIEDL